VYWSGILEAGPEAREVVYDVPDYFNGTLTVMAVAVADDAVGAAERATLVRGPFVITPGVPTLAAPGDEFEIGVTVANNVEGSGPEAEVELTVATSGHFECLTNAAQTLAIAEGRERTTSVRLRVREQLGSGEITFRARRGETASQLRSTVSVRPATPFLTQVRSGNFTKQLDLPLTRVMHPEFRVATAAVSAVPLGLAHGLDAYLQAFPHGCSEQITSGAFARLMLADEADFGLSRAEVGAQIEHTFAVLRRRQNDQGAIGYWAPAAGDEISFVAVYAMHFLIEAKAAGFAPPAEMFASGLRYLRSVATKEASDAEEARTIAYAIYLLTREGTVTTNYILNLQDYLEKNQADEWEHELTGAYLAGALKMLRKENEAEKLIAQYRMAERSRGGWSDFHQPLGSDAQYLAILARDFPERMQKISALEFEHILRPIGSGEFSTLSAAYAVLALKAYSHRVAQDPPELKIATLDGDKRPTAIASSRKLFARTALDGAAAVVRFEAKGLASGPGAFFQVVEAGFDRKLPNEPLAEGLEIYRELLDAHNQPVTQTRLGEAVNVRLRVRSLRPE
ncbi:MAG: alpha-2-macroglobulin family protein, partial [Chthoniobacterales bacterium]